MNLAYLESLFEDGYSPEEINKTINEAYSKWTQKKENKKVEEARTALAVAAANFAEALGVEVPQSAIDQTIDMLKNLENEAGTVQVKVSPDSAADKRLKKFLRGII